MRNKLTCAVAMTVGIVLATSSHGTANATLLVQIERVSDTQAIVTATGNIGSVLPPGNNLHIIGLDNVFGTAPPATENADVFGSSTLSIGGVSVNFAYDIGSQFDGFGDANPGIYFGGNFPLAANASFLGALDLSLTPGTTLASIGSSGDVDWSIFPSVVVGTWQVVAAPEPASLALFATAWRASARFGGARASLPDRTTSARVPRSGAAEPRHPHPRLVHRAVAQIGAALN